MHSNNYHRQLSDEQIEKRRHRKFVGGLWDEIGLLQLQFLMQKGLQPHHHLADIGCGAIRGGLHFIEYLKPGLYYGLDFNASLIKAAKVELENAKLVEKNPNFVVDDTFDVGLFGQKFDFMLSVSLFTHLPINSIISCLRKVHDNLSDDGAYFSSFFNSQESTDNAIAQKIKTIITYADKDPYHYSMTEFEWMAQKANLTVEYIGDWKHPRHQEMLCFRKR
jgi:cyclopropane fatty-acyl-phospholipid synthase-like methyltransferase